MMSQMEILKKYPGSIFILLIALLILFVVGKRSYNTKILPFQSITLNCKINGEQLFPKDGKGAKYAPIVKFPKVFKIKFGFYDGEFLEGGEVLIENHFLKKKKFGYQYAGNSLIIQPTYMPPWIPSYDPPGNSMYFIFPLNFKKREDLWIDYFWMMGLGSVDDYDAHYECDKIKL